MNEPDRMHNLQLADTQSLTILRFRLADQLYGVSIADIRQIVEMVAITPLAQVPAFMPGVINYHGTLIPLVDLRLRFNLPFQPYRLHTPILLSVFHDRLLGIVVDSVDAVQEIAADRYRAYDHIIPPELNAIAEQPIPQAFWAGLVESENQIMPIVKPTQLLSATEQATLQQVLMRADDASAITPNDATHINE